MIQTRFKTIFCFSHLRWDFVYQRPQHLLSRFAQLQNVYFWEEPIFDSVDGPYITISQRQNNLKLVTPHLPQGMDEKQQNLQLGLFLKDLIAQANLQETLFWYYTPMALPFSQGFEPAMTIYDSMSFS